MATPPKKSATNKPSKPARPSHLAKGRWLGDFPKLSAAEKRLVECCARGEVWRPEGWDRQKTVRPVESDLFNAIRAELIRFLVMGGDEKHPVHEAGVMVHGAWITGKLSLHQCRTVLRLDLKHCHFDSAPLLTAAYLPELVLIGSKLPGLRADRLRVSGSVFMRDGFAANGEVGLKGAKIGGTLDCSNGTFTNKSGNALSADGISVTGDIFLRDGFAAIGNVRIPGAEIGGNLECGRGKFSKEDDDALNADGIKVLGDVYLCDDFVATGEIRLLGAEIGGDLACIRGTFNNEHGDALSADGIKVRGGLFLRTAKVSGAILLSSARIGTLVDQDFVWQADEHIFDGLQYDRIIGPTDASRRIEWLKCQRADHLDARDWAPQPWEQLIKVLREMGHPGAAAEVAMEKQRMMRAAGQIGTREPNTRYKWAWRRKLDAGWTRISNVLVRQFHDFYGWIAGYGYRPTRIVGKMALLWLACGGLYWAAADRYGAIGPADPAITSATLYPEAADLCGHGNEPGKIRWTECPGVPDEYSTFQPFVYSLDLILPLIDLQQESDWAPIAEGPTGQDLLPGVIVRWVMWLEILFGWFASLMFVAIVSRLVEKD